MSNTGKIAYVNPHSKRLVLNLKRFGPKIKKKMHGFEVSAIRTSTHFGDTGCLIIQAILRDGALLTEAVIHDWEGSDTWEILRQFIHDQRVPVIVETKLGKEDNVFPFSPDRWHEPQSFYELPFRTDTPVGHKILKNVPIFASE